MMGKMGGLGPNAPKPNALLAAARRIVQRDRNSGVKVNRKAGGYDWQEEAWDLYGLVGELRFITTNLAGQAGKARLYAGKRDSDETPEEVDPSHPAAMILDDLGGSPTVRQQMIERLAINLFVAGEGWLVGIRKSKSPDSALYDMTFVPSSSATEYDWYMKSVAEVSVDSTSGQISVEQEDGERTEYSPSDVYLIRVWRPHPRKFQEADSPTRSSIPVLKELVGLTMHVSAQVDSRLAGAGMLVVPQSAQNSAGYDEDENGNGYNAAQGQDYFSDALVESMITPIGDRASAAALVPLVVTVPDESTGKFEYFDFANSLDPEARELRDEAIRRLALGLDAPPELLLGTSDMNHWGGWLVQEETVSAHIEPTLALVCEALTTQYLWPMLQEQNVTDFEEYSIWYDVSQLITRPNLSSDALALYDKGVLSDEALRRSSGFDEADAPDEPVDIVTRTVLAMIEQNPQLLVNPGAEALMTQIQGIVDGKPVSPLDTSALPADTSPDEETPSGDSPAAADETATPDDTQPAGKIPDTAGDGAELPQ